MVKLASRFFQDPSSDSPDVDTPEGGRGGEGGRYLERQRGVPQCKQHCFGKDPITSQGEQFEQMQEGRPLFLCYKGQTGQGSPILLAFTLSAVPAAGLTHDTDSGSAQSYSPTFSGLMYLIVLACTPTHTYPLSGASPNTAFNYYYNTPRSRSAAVMLQVQQRHSTHEIHQPFLDELYFTLASKPDRDIVDMI